MFTRPDFIVVALEKNGGGGLFTIRKIKTGTVCCCGSGASWKKIKSKELIYFFGGINQSYQFHRLLCSFFSAESDKGIASVQATEWIHHQSQVPDGAGFLKEWNQLVLKEVSGYFAYKYLTERNIKRSSFQVGKTTAVFKLRMFPSALSGKLSK